MNEIYWITRFDAINGVFMTLLVISCIILSISFIGWSLNCEESYEFERKTVKFCKKTIKMSIIPLILGVLGAVFIPTTKEALTIYGIGGTIDYLKENPTAKQLPDKCINALDRWVDSTLEKDSIGNN